MIKAESKQDASATRRILRRRARYNTTWSISITLNKLCMDNRIMHAATTNHKWSKTRTGSPNRIAATTFTCNMHPRESIPMKWRTLHQHITWLQKQSEQRTLRNIRSGANRHTQAGVSDCIMFERALLSPSLSLPFLLHDFFRSAKGTLERLSSPTSKQRMKHHVALLHRMKETDSK